MRRGVVTGSVLQGMALTVPIGGLSFLVMTIAFGELHQLVVFPMAALAWLACQGVVHFVIGRYCNYRSNQLMGVNLTAPVVQLQVPFAMLLAVVMLHEKFTVLQAIGSALMLAISQAFVYASLAVAPLMVVTPILQLSLVFRLFLSQLINRDYEVMNTAVVIGAVTAVLGSILVSLDTDQVTTLLDLPLSLAGFLRYRLAGD